MFNQLTKIIDPAGKATVFGIDPTKMKNIEVIPSSCMSKIAENAGRNV